MNGMEFTWHMVATLAWPIVVIVTVFVFRKWIIKNLEYLGITFGKLSVQLKALNTKVDTVGQDISMTLSGDMAQPAGDGIPESLVDLMATVSQDRMAGVHAAFDVVHRALKENYPQLRRVLPAQLPEAMDRLAANKEMEPDVAQSVKQLYELMVMPEWQKDQAGDTRGYAFLMLAEGAIHGILRSAQARGAETSGAETGGDSLDGGPAPIRRSWRGIYNSRFPIELEIGSWSGMNFGGTMTYPDGDTATSITGTAKDAAGSIGLTWKELEFIRRGSRSIDFNGNYEATITGETMEGAWYQGSRRVARFTMTAFDRSATPALPG
jgi:hypothetical protein